VSIERSLKTMDSDHAFDNVIENETVQANSTNPHHYQWRCLTHNGSEGTDVHPATQGKKDLK